MPTFARRYLASRWKRRAQQIADKVEPLMKLGLSYTIAAREIDPDLPLTDPTEPKGDDE